MLPLPRLCGSLQPLLSINNSQELGHCHVNDVARVINKTTYSEYYGWAGEMQNKKNDVCHRIKMG